MRRRLYLLRDYIDNLPDDWSMPDDLQLTVTATYYNGDIAGSVSVDLFETTDWIDFFATYYDWGYNWLSTNSADTFADVWRCWVNNNQTALDKAFTAYYAAYDPIANYDRRETTTNTANKDYSRTSGVTRKGNSETYADTGSLNQLGGKLSATVQAITDQMDLEAELTSDYVHITPTQSTQSREVSATVDSSGAATGFRVSGITISESSDSPYTEQGTRAYDGTERSDTYNKQTGSTAARSVSMGSGSTHDTTAEAVNEDTTDTSEGTLHAYGNIGVTTSAQMVTEEINLRIGLNFAKMVMDQFARECLYYGGW